MYKAIIFDCDGTLLDTKIMIQLLHDGYKKFYPNRDDKPYEAFIPCYFFTNMQTKAYLQIPDVEYEAFLAMTFPEDAMQHSTPFAGMIACIKKLHANGYLLGINTSRIHEHMQNVRQLLTPEAYDLFQIVVTSQDVPHPKPAPDSLLLVKQLSKCTMEQILYIGDSENDALCANSAGCDFALAGWGLVDKNLPEATYVLRSIEDLLALLHAPM